MPLSQHALLNNVDPLPLFAIIITLLVVKGGLLWWFDYRTRR